ncbi:F-box protein [Phanerochaete sordida]|uniref:F-box protein n=1 Tax=Phanerochaete sordida TaxID=48140 RepID=A0A9P3G4C8_9APHY|nr:F-box protein [Phanerochaete sordida]
MGALPNELSDYIVDFLHDDRQSLKSCSLTCRSWYPAARFHLYDRVYLSSPAAACTLQELLHESPYVGQFTQHLVMAKVAPQATPDPHKDNGQEPALRTWEPLFSALPNVHQLGISWLEIDIAFQSALLHNFVQTTELTLQYCRFPSFGGFASVLHSFPSLQQCTLRGISWETSPELLLSDPVEERAAHICIKNLTLGRDLDLQLLVEWLLQEHICDELESISACLAYESDAIMLGELLRVSAPTLKHVELDWYCSSYRDVRLPFEFTLAGCANLETLSLHCPIALGATVPWVNALLADVNPAKLESVALDIRLLGTLFGLNWARLEGTLLQDTFTSLSKVAVKVTAWHTATEYMDDIPAFVRCHLPQLHSRNILQYIK